MQAELARIVGAGNVLDGEGLSDASRLPGYADALVLPETPEQVAAVVAWAYEHDVPVVPRGGATGMAGGAAPMGGVAVSLARLNAVRELAPLQWRMCVEAGVTTATVQRLARENGLYYPPDPGAAEDSQIGGNVATNAGGPHCFKYGVTRAFVTGVEAVLAPGELVTAGGPARKDVAGYDLAGLLCGSEGTLGIVTAVWLRLVPAPAARRVVYQFSEDLDDAIQRFMACGFVPSALEYVDRRAFAAAAGSFPGQAGEGSLVIAEADGPGEAFEEGTPIDAAELWRWRDGISHAVAAVHGAKLAEDVAVPVERLGEAVTEVAAIGARHGIESCSWGHAGDGNLHANFLFDPGDTPARARADAAAEDVFAMALRLGGTLSGEHGLGRLKPLRGAPAAHAALKRALDPKGLLNPGVKEPASRGG
jgi:FAD/FMN-containing dehydrogenase